MREGKLKEQFDAAADRLRNANITPEQLDTLQSIQYLYTHYSEQRVGLCCKRRAFLIGAVILLFTAGCLTLSPLSQLPSILLECCGLQVTYVALLQNSYGVGKNCSGCSGPKLMY